MGEDIYHAAQEACVRNAGTGCVQCVRKEGNVTASAKGRWQATRQGKVATTATAASSEDKAQGECAAAK